MEKKFYSKQEIAGLFGLNERTIEKYLLSGKLKCAKLGKNWKISSEDVQAFYDASKAETEKNVINERKKKAGLI